MTPTASPSGRISGSTIADATSVRRLMERIPQAEGGPPWIAHEERLPRVDGRLRDPSPLGSSRWGSAMPPNWAARHVLLSGLSARNADAESSLEPTRPPAQERLAQKGPEILPHGGDGRIEKFPGACVHKGNVGRLVRALS